jgi:hypothetical protein
MRPWLRLYRPVGGLPFYPPASWCRYPLLMFSHFSLSLFIYDVEDNKGSIVNIDLCWIFELAIDRSSSKQSSIQ